jgi:hypothetical protein
LRRKLLIVPWFGPLPTWIDAYTADTLRLPESGYTWLLDQDLRRFKARCRDRLGVDCPIKPGTGKIWDYRPALAVLYRDEIAGFDYWGHTDLDCVYGNPATFEDELDGADVWTDGWDYVNGPWTLYRNAPELNTLFAACDGWAERLADPVVSGWVETVYSDHVKRELGAGFHQTLLQAEDLDAFAGLERDGDRLLEHGREVLLAHFRRTKTYPLGGGVVARA